ncbi:MAG: 5-formyltetrahydrofolate cyclo-ligase [Hahellaceae bacterium]|nr:5-formyltetrahydrofolate cyclo-ligase [Hahellaceae bacterium]
MDRKSIRQSMRRLRNALSTSEQNIAAEALRSNIQRHLLLRRNARVALYLPNDGEIDPRPLITALSKRNIHCYLPVLHPTSKQRLWFFHFDNTTKMQTNRFGIKEPCIRYGQKVAPWTLTAALFPLVAFDCEGGRLGMGGGFYDRTFAPKVQHARSLYDSIKLIGLAHHFQQVSKLPIEPWDVPLSAIATDKGVIKVAKHERPIN